MWGIALPAIVLLATVLVGCGLGARPGQTGTDSAATVSGPSQGMDLPVGPEVGLRGPDFTLEDLAGQQVSLSGYRGRPVLVNFFATWCGPCAKELPVIQAAAEREQATGLTALLIDVQEDRATVQRFASRLRLTSPILLDTTADIFYDKYRVPGLPATYFLDREGVVRVRVVTALEEADLEAGLAAIR